MARFAVLILLPCCIGLGVLSVGCGKASGPPPTLATSIPENSTEKPRLTLQTDSIKINGKGVSEETWAIPRGENLTIEVVVKAGTWGLSQVPTVMFVRAGQPAKPIKSYPPVAGDPVLNFPIIVFRGKTADLNAIHFSTIASFVPGERADEGTLTYMLPKIDNAGDYVLRFLAASQSTDSGQAEPLILGEQAIVVR